MPYIGKSPSAGVRQRYQYTATAGQTTFSGTDLGNLTLTYTDNNFVDVFQNGVLLKGGGTDYTATSGTSVVLTTGASVSDVIEIIVYDVFSVGNFFNRTDSDSRYVNVDGDTMTGSLDLNGTELVLDADGDTSITADTDDQIDFKTGGSDAVTIDASGNMGLGTSSINNIGAANRVLEINGGSLSPWIHFTNNTSGVGASDGHILGTEGVDTYHINRENGTQRFHTNNTERMRIQSDGSVLINTTDDLIYPDSSGAGGIVFSYANYIQVMRDGGGLMWLNRISSDGDLISFYQDGSKQGDITVSGSTVSYNGFSGLHESSGIATDTPKGTVVSTIDELDVYSAKQGETEEQTDNPRAGQTRADHAKVKVSDTTGDKAVYGVVGNFNAQGKVNVVSVGVGSVRVTGACAKGDLLESNGDGTAKVQSDDIVRSKTIGKVTIGNSSTDEKLVSCVLYCG